MILDQALQENTKQTKEAKRLCDAKSAADRAVLQSKLTKEFKVIVSYRELYLVQST